MILTCPSCATSYFAPDDAIGPHGRTVRCKSCKHTWRASLDEPLELSATATGRPPRETAPREEPVPESLAETPAPELPRAFRARAEQQRRLRRAAAHGAVWAGLASAFAVLLAAAWLFRVEVVEMAPRTAAAYAAVGLTVNPTGLDFEAVSARPLPTDPGRILVSGALRNVREDERVAPPVRVALLDAHGAEVGHAVVRIDAAPVLPGKVQGFAAVIPDPGARAQGIGVDFALDQAPAAPPPPARTSTRRAPAAPAPAPAAPAAHPEPVAARPLPVATSGDAGLRPAMGAGPAARADLRPVDAVPLSPALDSDRSGAVSPGHG
ncbi:MJ0042-type zinc finger domain-containing protein [Brevundimonas sp.]|uniref:MJ0042-type zinc finger domain-containing protein n=1 Tax=Brevundimonas sp. TaxID=1871086 RepID=UPI0035B365B2